jgi:hypothetical protein
MAFGAGKVAETAHIDDRNVVAPAPRDLRHRATLHLDGVRAELLAQAPPRAFGVDEAVAGQDRTEMNRGRARSGADRGAGRGSSTSPVTAACRRATSPSDTP